MAMLLSNFNTILLSNFNTILLSNFNTIFNDAPQPWQLGFQDST